ncbi:hypothetical protein HQ586_09970 [Candidatus Bathyarchaeota archaeon]|nr:hypothetical protein [Candidatus Bathyarchaeota archaeon]
MTNLVCPLCGRHVSLSIFDPSRFESDIFAVDVRGLGRGRGFAISEAFSVLGEPEITGVIAERCRIILGFIEGKTILSGGEASVLRAEVERWKGEALRERRSSEDLFAKLAELEEQARFLTKEASRSRWEREEHVVQLAGLEDEVRKWRYEAVRLKAEVDRLKSELNGRDDDDEEEMLAMEEMQEVLDRINASANADFEYLTDAVEFLLEAG